MKSSAPLELLEFIADMRVLPDVVQSIRVASALADLHEATALRVELVVEELFTNTVVHGYGIAPNSTYSQGRVWVRFMTKAPHGLLIQYQDAARPFNPLQKAAEVCMEMEAAVELHQRKVGGLGCALIVNLADEIQYAYEHEKNRLAMTFYART